MHKLELLVNGSNYAGWKTVRIKRSIEQLAGTFDLSVSERWPGQTVRMPIGVGDRCELKVDGTPIITGHIDEVSMSYNATSHEVTVRGRDAAGDLVDCSIVNVEKTEPGWKGSASDQKLEQIAQALCAPFGIKVSTATDTGERIKHFATEKGESVFEALTRMARSRGVFIISDGIGGILITRTGTRRVPNPLVRGENILAASREISIREWYKDYTVYGDSQGDGAKAGAESKGTAKDDTNPRDYRPRVMTADTQGDIGSFNTRAEWEAKIRRSKASRISVTVQGWKHQDGLWQPNTLVSLRDEWLRLAGEFLIVSVTFTMDLTGGTRTELELAQPEAFDLLAPPDKKKGAA
jgi:prophage tail gpP-like protein